MQVHTKVNMQTKNTPEEQGMAKVILTEVGLDSAT